MFTLDRKSVFFGTFTVRRKKRREGGGREGGGGVGRRCNRPC